MSRRTVLAPITLGLPFLLACAGTPPTDLGVTADRLAPCPDSPNCVSSDAPDDAHRVAPLALAAAPDVAWRAARDAVAAQPRTEVVEQTDTYLRAACTSAVFRFVDDLELHLRPAAGVIAVRSASRLGRSDLGVNRERVGALRARLAEKGVVESGADGR